MTNDEFRTAIETLWPGHGSQTRAAEHFGISSRRVREFVSGERNVPQGVADELADLAAMFPDGVRTVNPPRALAILHQAMRRAGWTDDQSAAAILGASMALARQHIAAEELRKMLDDDHASPA